MGKAAALFRVKVHPPDGARPPHGHVIWKGQELNLSGIDSPAPEPFHVPRRPARLQRGLFRRAGQDSRPAGLLQKPCAPPRRGH